VFDQSDLEKRPDLLIYSTEPLRAGVTIAGSVRARLYISSDAKDTDFTAKLVDVDPAGHSWNIATGIKRVRYRNGYDRTVWMDPGQVYSVEISRQAVS